MRFVLAIMVISAVFFSGFSWVNSGVECVIDINTGTNSAMDTDTISSIGVVVTATGASFDALYIRHMPQDSSSFLVSDHARRRVMAVVSNYITYTPGQPKEWRDEVRHQMTRLIAAPIPPGITTQEQYQYVVSRDAKGIDTGAYRTRSGPILEVLSADYARVTEDLHLDNTFFFEYDTPTQEAEVSFSVINPITVSDLTVEVWDGYTSLDC